MYNNGQKGKAQTSLYATAISRKKRRKPRATDKKPVQRAREPLKCVVFQRVRALSRAKRQFNAQTSIHVYTFVFPSLSFDNLSQRALLSRTALALYVCTRAHTCQRERERE